MMASISSYGIKPEITPFTLEEEGDIVLGRAFFWYFLDNVFIKSFSDTETYTDPITQLQVPFKFADLHREWALLAQYNPRFCIQAPRAHLKSTVMGQGFPFWLMASVKEGEYKDGMYFSYKAELADEKVADLKRRIKDNPYCRYWKDLKPTSQYLIDFLVDWGSGPIGEVTLKGSGITSATRGRHPKFVICDDILSDFSQLLGSAELKLINRIFRNTIMSLPANENDVLGLIGTPQSYDDILYQLAQNEDWIWLLYPAVKDYKTKAVQWPEKYDFNRLMRIKKDIGPTAFEVEYQLTPVTVTDQFLTYHDLLPSIDDNLLEWDLGAEFANPASLMTYGGFDVGKKVHPSHVSVLLELPNGSLITLFQMFLDHMSYPEQVQVLNNVASRFRLARGYFDSTFNVLEDRKLNRRWRGRIFNRKLKADVAVGFERRVFAVDDDPGIVIPNDRRFLSQISQVTKDMSADENADGHGDSFWSMGLAIKACDDGPVITDIGNSQLGGPPPQGSQGSHTNMYRQLQATLKQ